MGVNVFKFNLIDDDKYFFEKERQNANNNNNRKGNEIIVIQLFFPIILTILKEGIQSKQRDDRITPWQTLN